MRWMLVLIVIALFIMMTDCKRPIPFVMTAWEPELDVILQNSRLIRSFPLVGRIVYQVEIDKKQLYVSRVGIGMVNAALTTQAIIDQLGSTPIINAGIAGSMRHMNIGDVSILSTLSPYQENMYYAKMNESVLTHNGRDNDDEGYGFMYINPSEILRVSNPGVSSYELVRRVDTHMMNVATIASRYVNLTRCIDDVCLDTVPTLHIGGTGLSASAFLDNASWREWLNSNTDLNTESSPIRTHDMESASIAHVCDTNNVKYMIIRSTSDLAGADIGENPGMKYVPIAAENMYKVLRSVLKQL